MRDEKQTKVRRGAARRRRWKGDEWAALSDEKLLELRFCDLNLSIEGTWLEKMIDRLERDLQRCHIRFRPHYWLSDEWFTPDGVPGVAIPFYLAHLRLMRLEERQMLEVEGGTQEWCMRLLRHEVGHAIANAYRLYRRSRWRRVFGPASRRYPNYYRPKPYSRRFVLHLDYWYAQSHPSEDFAETFAVWLTPSIPWRRRYAGWPALHKLEYVDELMREIGPRKPAVTSRERIDPASTLTTTLRKHYEKKRARYGSGYPDFYDRDLRRLFSDEKTRSRGESAAAFLRRIRPDIRALVAHWTGEHQYTIDQVLKEMIVRCRELRLRRYRPERQLRVEATIMLTVQTMNYLHGGHHRLVL